MSAVQSVDGKIVINIITLAFNDRDLEEKFLETYRLNSIRTILTYAPWLAIVLTTGFGVLFWIYHFPQPLIFLYCLGMISMCGLYCHFRYFTPSYRLLEIIFTLGAVGFGWVDSTLLIFFPQLQNYVWGLVGIHIVSTSLALPVRFLPALINQSLVLLGFVFIAIGLSDLTVADAFVQILLLNGIAGLSFFVAYWREKLWRENFIQNEKITLYSQALRSELEKGRRIQRDFLPTRIPQIQNCDITSYFHPALQLSGDFYDVFKLPGNRVGLVIADVSDKGVGSALFMALLRSLIRVFSGHSQLHCSTNNDCDEHPALLKNLNVPFASDAVDPLDAVFLTNEYIAKEHGEEGMFATLFFGIINPSTGLLSYINGGHEPLIIVGTDGIKKRLPPTGPAVGMMPGSNYKVGKTQLDHGDILFGYTDGVTEARSPLDELYTRKRLEKSVVNSTWSTATDFSENVKSDLFKFIEQAPQSDDITMIVVRWGGDK